MICYAMVCYLCYGVLLQHVVRHARNRRHPAHAAGLRAAAVTSPYHRCGASRGSDHATGRRRLHRLGAYLHQPQPVLKREGAAEDLR